MPRTTPEDSISFWTERLAGVPPVLDLAVARPRRRAQPYTSGELTSVLPPSPDEASPLEWRLLAALLVVLDRYCAQEDLLVGIDRSVFQAEDDFGGDLVPLRINLAGDPTGSTLIERIAEAIATTRPHHTLSFSEVLDAAAIERADSHHPLVQVVFCKAPVAASEWPVPGAVTGVAPDLGLQLVTGSGDAQARLVFNTELFDEATIRCLMTHLEVAFRTVSEMPHRRVRRLPLLDSDELVRITREWNATSVE